MPDQEGPDENEVVELAGSVAEKIESRVDKREKLVAKAREKADDLEKARAKAESQIYENRKFIEAVAALHDVDPDEYVYDRNRQALRPMTQVEKEQRAREG